jgi:hypothetical protein
MKSVILFNVTTRFTDGVSNIVASKEKYVETKTWVLLHKRVENVAVSEEYSSEDDNESNSPKKKRRKTS